ncbi:MAG: GNAT family N-acetyltransferase [Methylacidiphilaceae bacterium]|nr:GNAT family N-acetyltransferase [Candidatus Methylacidiphilaceae bacterium]
MNSPLSAPQPLSAAHRVGDFSCGEPVLDEWLKRRAMANQQSGASRTFVVVDPDNGVQGYYAMAAGAVARRLATGAVRRNMPDPVPVLVLARLAVDSRIQGHHLGGAMLQDAVQRAVAVSQNAASGRCSSMPFTIARGSSTSTTASRHRRPSRSR